VSSKLQKQMGRLLDTEKKYNKLIMAVETKYPGETRHETALRYIKDRENSTVHIVSGGVGTF